MDLVFAPSQIETWPIDRLRPYVRNAKMHGDDQVAKIAASMAKFGWTVPCLVADDGELIAGHGRVLAAKRLGLASVPAIRLAHLTEAQARALHEILDATPIGSEVVRVDAQLGCGNMPCDTARPRGMHTNGRCHCDEATVRRAALAWREYALSLEARLCGGPAR